MRAARLILPKLNPSGGAQATVQRAVRLLEEAGAPERYFAAAATLGERKRFIRGDPDALVNYPAEVRLALEMAAHEDTERRALEGELAQLEEAWRQAEEIAAIADDMFLPANVRQLLQKYRRG